MQFDEYAELGEDPDDFVEEELVPTLSNLAISNDNDASAPPVAHAIPPTPPVAHVLTEELIAQMTVNKLKQELEKRGKPKTGKKDVLVQRLKASMNAPVSETLLQRHGSMAGLDITAKWCLLDPNPTPIPNPTNKDTHLRPPTERDGSLNPKYGYDELFKCKPFKGTTANMQYIYDSKENHKKSAGRKKPRTSSLSPVRKARNSKVDPREKGGPNSSFLKKYGLNEHSYPVHWLNALLPMYRNDNHESIKDVDVTNDGKTKFSVSMWTMYTNMKASFENAGEPGHIYAGKWKNFSTDEIRTIIGVYMIDGLAPSPRLAQKMQPQAKNKTQGNDILQEMWEKMQSFITSSSVTSLVVKTQR